MDTTETYIKMCDCEEIQGEWKKLIKQDDWDCSDFVYDKSGETCSETYCLGGEAGMVAYDFPDEYAWLPRQDQIQEMMEGYEKPHYLIVSLINFMQDQQKFYKSGKVKRLYPTASMEQLWLAFYMYKKHSKVWYGEKWIKK